MLPCSSGVYGLLLLAPFSWSPKLKRFLSWEMCPAVCPCQHLPSICSPTLHQHDWVLQSFSIFQVFHFPAPKMVPKGYVTHAVEWPKSQLCRLSKQARNNETGLVLERLVLSRRGAVKAKFNLNCPYLLFTTLLSLTYQLHPPVSYCALCGSSYLSALESVSPEHLKMEFTFQYLFC